MINRWRLEKANPHAKLSPPTRQIVWYVEDTVPIEYRPYVEDGIREWNKAFETDRVPRRHRRPMGRGGPRPVRPRGHAILHLPMGHRRDGIRPVLPAGRPHDRRDDRRRRRLRLGLHPHWKQEYALLVASKANAEGGEAPAPLALGEVVSPILASKMGYGQPAAGQLLGMDALDATRTGSSPRSSRRIRTSSPGSSPAPPRGPAAPSANSSPASSATSRSPRSRWPTPTGEKEPKKKKTRRTPSARKPAGEGRAPRGVPRPGDQGAS